MNPLSAMTVPGETNFRAADRVEVFDRVNALRDAGHAILMDEIFDAEHRLDQVRVFHYRTCPVCAREK